MSEPNQVESIGFENTMAAIIEACKLLCRHFSAFFEEICEAIVMSDRQKWLQKKRYYRQQGYRRVNKRLIKKWEKRH